MTNYSELEKALDNLGYGDSAVKKAVTEVFYVLDANELNVDERRMVSQLVNSMVEKRLIVESTSQLDGVWHPFRLGETRKGAIVRVMKDAYDTDGGKLHNGLVGYLVDIRSGRCIIQYLGRNDGVGHYHPPQKIEVLKK